MFISLNMRDYSSKIEVELSAQKTSLGNVEMAMFQHIKGRAKVELELNLARDAKNSKKCFYGYVSQERKAKESRTPLMSKAGRLVTNEEKAEMLSSIFVSVFCGSLSFHTSLVDGLQDEDWGNNEEGP
ncbi:hypothetical protein HGM15179_007298 [Zosterops borbonicus]|uniref:Uncharacterized protein n=1 Tax=Zosterops borbonicus TaxID=364589 RepID=A0A8K1GIZ1_9PASS|nr:hypothetical protein HGM15179_007298 [Zosterops borbonicus]